ncbi:MAG: hypothetical protein ACRDTE_21980 [Pseudonocardiaceae bacterium]
MDIQNVSQALKEKMMRPTRDDVESVYYGEADPQDVKNALANPRRLAEAVGVPTTDESQYHVCLQQRKDRHTKIAASPSPQAARRAIVIVFHYECCCGDIIILGW